MNSSCSICLSLNICCIRIVLKQPETFLWSIWNISFNDLFSGNIDWLQHWKNNGCFRLFFSISPYTVKPSIITQPKSTAPQEGDTVKLYCNATGSPILHISWTFDGSFIKVNKNSRISLSNDSQELTITNVTRGDSGDYRCLVKNRVGNDSSDPSVINVLCKYRISLLF